MRRLAFLAFTTLVSSPAAAGSHAMMHDRMLLPPPSPAYVVSDGDRYGRLQPRPENNLDRIAKKLTGGKGRADLFSYPFGETAADGALAGTFSNGSAQLQLRWTTAP